MNFWSLAVEEQFYLCWPFVFAFVMAFVHTDRGRVRAVLGVAGVSALSMGVLFTLSASSTRVYYGTDTHLFGLMIGAALAFAWDCPAGPLDAPRWQRIRTPAALSALVALVLLMGTLAENSSFTFRGGILLASLLTAVVIAGLLGPDNALRRGLQLPLLVWVGERSYGIYLWHWPMILVVTTALPAASADSALSWIARGLAGTLTVLFSWASYRWLEVPVRRLGFTGAGHAFAGWVSQPWAQTRLPRLPRWRCSY